MLLSLYGKGYVIYSIASKLTLAYMHVVSEIYLKVKAFFGYSGRPTKEQTNPQR